LNYTTYAAYGNVFALNASSGALTLLSSAFVHYQTQNAYALTCQATASGASGANVTTSVSVLVNIVNVDSSPPQFVPSSGVYAVNVSQSWTVGSAVLQVQAFDPDYMEQVVFALSAPSAFAVNATSGVISLTSPLSYAATPNYTLGVVASKLRIATASTAQVLVLVQYANAYAPVFTAPTAPSVTVNGVLPAGTPLFTAAATDPNVPAGQANIAYSLTTAPASLLINATTVRKAWPATYEFEYI
jgi:hypothetical protein